MPDNNIFFMNLLIKKGCISPAMSLFLYNYRDGIWPVRKSNY